PVTHRNLVITADKRKSWFDFTPNDRSLCATPLHYGQALKGVLFTPLLLGGSVAYPDRTVDYDVLSWLADLQPTWLDASPALLINLLDRAEARREAPLHHCLRFIRSGAAPLPLAVRQGLEEVFGVPVLEDGDIGSQFHRTGEPQTGHSRQTFVARGRNSRRGWA